MSSLTSAYDNRTLLQIVNEILNGIGENSASSVSESRAVTTKAVYAVNDALQEIWGRAQWEFRRDWHSFDLSAGNSYYAMPANYREMGSDLWFYKGTPHPIPQISYEEMMQRFPAMTAVPPGEFSITWYNYDASAYRSRGEPRYFAVVYAGSQEYLFIQPTPSTDFVGEVTGKAAFNYFTSAPDMVENADETPLPRALWTAHKFLALAYLKQAMEHQDWQVDEARAERYIQRELARRTGRSKTKLAFKPGSAT